MLLRVVALGMVAALASAGPTPGGGARAAAAGAPLVEGVKAPVSIRVFVSDATGRPLDRLAAADFDVLAGDRPQPLERVVPPSRGPRAIGILLDEYHLSPAAAAHARAALLEFAQQQLRDDDAVFVVKPLDQASTLAPVADAEVLRTRLASLSGRLGDYTPQTPFEREYISAAPPAAARQRAQIVRASMQALATALGRLPDAADRPRAMLVVTEGFPLEERGRERLATLRTVARAARFASVGVYVTDPSPAPREETPLGDAWAQLAAQTGGAMTPAGTPLPPVLARFASDLDASYLLTIPPVEREDGSYHRVQVTVKRKGAIVRAPTGFWAPIAAERLTPPARPAMSTYLKTPHISGLIQPWLRWSRGEGALTRVVFAWAPRPGRGRSAVVKLSAVTFEGARLAESEVGAQGAAGTLPAVASFDAPPGPVQLAMEIRDAAGKVLDTEVRYVDVPALDRPGPMITAVDLIRTRSLPEFLARQKDANVMPSDAAAYDRRDRLIVRVRAMASGGDAPAVTARFLNALGQPIRELTPLAAVDGIAQFDLSLAPYPRGDYRLEIRAAAGGGATSQLVMLRLTGS